MRVWPDRAQAVFSLSPCLSAFTDLSGRYGITGASLSLIGLSSANRTKSDRRGIDHPMGVL